MENCGSFRGFSFIYIIVADLRIVRDNFFYDNDIYIYIYIARVMVIWGFGLWINFVLLKISIRNRIRKFYCRFYFWNIISTILDWLICTFSNQWSIFCMLHVILCFYKGKGTHDPNDPLHFSCMLGYLGCEMCLFQKLYVEGFVDSFAA